MVFGNYFGFALLRSVIGKENSRHLKTNQGHTKSSRNFVTLGNPCFGKVACTRSSLMIFPSALICHSDYFEVGLTILDYKALQQELTSNLTTS